MTLVNELENDLALAFFVDKIHSEKIETKEFVALLNRVREILDPENVSDDTVLTSPGVHEARAH